MGRWLAVSIGLSAVTMLGADLDPDIAHFDRQLKEQVFPYWSKTVDREHGGYLLGDPGPVRGKQLVGQSRMIWGFSLAHRKGYGTQNHDYLAAARQGWQFLRRHFWDQTHGGYYWSTDVNGEVTNPNKIVYGEAFVIYGLVEFYRASGEREALDQALELFHTLQTHAHDRQHGGWIEHFKSDWKPILAPSSDAPVEVPGYKSANTHLHLMEAFTELYEASGEETVRNALEEALDINRRYFYPPEAGESDFHRQLDWQPVTDPASAGLSYGHNVEFAWLMIRAERALKAPLSWRHFYAHLDHALEYGYDHVRGGLYDRGFNDKPATKKDKIWWVEAEMLAVLTEALAHKQDPRYLTAMTQLIHFLRAHQIDPEDGIWFATVAENGEVKSASKAGNWKANYHDVRALIKLIDAFGQR